MFRLVISSVVLCPIRGYGHTERYFNARRGNNAYRLSAERKSLAEQCSAMIRCDRSFILRLNGVALETAYSDTYPDLLR